LALAGVASRCHSNWRSRRRSVDGNCSISVSMLSVVIVEISLLLSSASLYPGRRCSVSARF
jgi:hypothetical protein